MGLGILFLRVSGVERLDCTFEARLPGGGKREVRLSAYQALNSPSKPISRLEGHERDQVFEDAITELIRLYDNYKQSGSKLSKTQSLRHRLTIRLELGEKYLSQRYLGPYSSFLEHRTQWSTLKEQLNGRTRGDALFRVLFGLEKEDQCGEVLQRLLERTSDPLPNPTIEPIRICIETDSHRIADLPWRECSWLEQPLVDLGWTFELNPFSSANRQPSFADIHVQTPCPVLAIIPPLTGPNDRSIENHRHALQEALDNAWPIYKDRLLWAATLVQFKENLLSRSPDIIYFCGRCLIRNESLALVFSSSQGDQPIDLNELAALWEHNPPRILILSLVADDIPEVGIRIQTCVKGIPLIVVLRSPVADVQRARRSALKWLHYILRGDGSTDPVAALQLAGNRSDSAWTAYEKWRVHTLRTTPQERLARLLLDRWEQRTMVRGLVDEMRQQGQRRMTSFVAYGEKGNLVDQAAEQFMEYMRRHASEAIRIQPFKRTARSAQCA